MELTSITREIYEAATRLRKSNEELYRLGNEKAEAERVYRTELAKAIAVMRYEKVQATLISDLARGEVADLKFARDLSHDRYRSALSAIDNLRTEINALQSILRVQSEV